MGQTKMKLILKTGIKEDNNDRLIILKGFIGIVRTKDEESEETMGSHG